MVTCNYLHITLLLLIETIASILSYVLPAEMSIALEIGLFILRLVVMEVESMDNNDKRAGCCNAGPLIML